MLKKIIEDQINKNNNRIAYKNENNFITYGDLWIKANKYADLLIRQGNKPVIVYGHKSIEMFVSIFACIIAGRTYIPIDISVPLNRIKKIIDLSGSTLLIANEPVDISGIEVCTLDELNRYSNKDKHESISDIIYIIFTSGTTGEPKGVPISEKNLLSFINWISSFDVLNDFNNINVLNQANFNFDLSVADIFYSICNGHTLVSLSSNNIKSFVGIFTTIMGNSINLIVTTPTFMKLCLLNSDFNEKNFPYLKCLYFCGELLDVNLVNELFNRFKNLNIINAYGPTEATSAVSAVLIKKDMSKEKVLPVGEISKFATDISIINDEIVLSGPSVFDGYLNDKESVKEYFTGDIGYIKNNYLYCVGRKDNQVKYRGYRIELGEIEYHINKIDGIVDCVVCPIYENNNIKYLKAFIVANGVKKQEVINSLRAEMPSYMIPKKIEFIDKLPVNANGKIDRKKLLNLNGY